MKKKTKIKIIKAVIAIILIVALAAGAYVGYVYFSYSRVPDRVSLEIELAGSYSYFEDKKTVNTEDYYNIMTYNIGFGAYTKDFSFFMDGGESSWAKSEEGLISNICEITDVINKSDVDFFFLQEVDVDGTRTYHVNEIDLINEFIKGYYYTQATSYDSTFLLYPIWQPHGANKAVMATYSKALISDSVRRSLPVADDFSKLFDMDRCYTVTKVPTENDRKLCLYNVHMSAYTEDGNVRNEQLKLLLADMEKEYKAGNYVICGGDFNMDLRPEHVESEYTWASAFPRDMLPEGFNLGIDVSKDLSVEHNSCRNANEPYNPETTFTVSTDGFIVSDNIMVNYYNHANWGYEYSDHDPVIIQIYLEK